MAQNFIYYIIKCDGVEVIGSKRLISNKYVELGLFLTLCFFFRFRTFTDLKHELHIKKQLKNFYISQITLLKKDKDKFKHKFWNELIVQIVFSTFFYLRSIY